MSHAVIIVALNGENFDPDKPIHLQREEVEKHVREQMAPFSERDEWFRDGSRWDWWTIGGRWTGMLDPAYDPYTDPRNIETCDLCDGTGTRNKPVPNQPNWQPTPGQCNGCQGKGTHVAWTLADHDGDIIRLRDLDLSQFKPDDPLSAFGFLRHREWHERHRMGFFGMSTPTECESADKELGDGQHCVHHDANSGAKIVSWNDHEEKADDTPRKWSTRYYDRFIKPLPPDTVLVVVDFHV